MAGGAGVRSPRLLATAGLLFLRLTFPICKLGSGVTLSLPPGACGDHPRGEHAGDQLKERVPSFIDSVFIEHLLGTRPWAKCRARAVHGVAADPPGGKRVAPRISNL